MTRPNCISYIWLLCMFPVRVRHKGDLESKRGGADIFQLTHIVADLLTHIVDRKRQLGLHLLCLDPPSASVSPRPCSALKWRALASARYPHHQSQKEQEMKRVSVHPIGIQLVLEGFSLPLGLPHFISVFPKWLHALWRSVSGTGCGNKALQRLFSWISWFHNYVCPLSSNEFIYIYIQWEMEKFPHFLSWFLWLVK